MHRESRAPARLNETQATMRSNPDAGQAHDDEQVLPSQHVRSFLSLFAIIHLFAVFVGVTCIYAPPSALHGRLLHLTAPYIQLLNFDVDYTPYFLTHYSDPGEAQFAQQADPSADSRIEILPDGEEANVDENWIVFPDAGFAGGERYKRYQRLAKQVANNADSDTLPASITSGVGTAFYHETGLVPYRIRCRTHRAQRREWVNAGTPEQRDPNSAMYFFAVYQATGTVGDDGIVEVVPDVAPGQAARVLEDDGQPDTNTQP